MSKQGKTLDVNRKGLFLLEEYLIKTATKLPSKALENDCKGEGTIGSYLKHPFISVFYSKPFSAQIKWAELPCLLHSLSACSLHEGSPEPPLAAVLNQCFYRHKGKRCWTKGGQNNGQGKSHFPLRSSWAAALLNRFQPYNPWADQHMGIWMYVTHFNVKAELRQEWNCNKYNHNPKC